MDDRADPVGNRAADLVVWASDLLRTDGASATTRQAIADAVRQLHGPSHDLGNFKMSERD
jgi:hypothetical protein